MAKSYYSTTEEDEKKKGYYKATEGYADKAYKRDLYQQEQQRTASQKAAEELKRKEEEAKANRPLLQKVGEGVKEGVTNFFKNAFTSKTKTAQESEMQYEEEVKPRKEWQVDKQPKEAHIKAAQVEIAQLDKKRDELDQFKSEADKYMTWGFDKQSELIRGGMKPTEAMEAIRQHNEMVRNINLDDENSPERKALEERMNQLGLNNKSIDPRKQGFRDTVFGAIKGTDNIKQSIDRQKGTWQQVIDAYNGETQDEGIKGGIEGLKDYATRLENIPVLKGAADTLYNIEEKKIQKKIAEKGEGSLTPQERSTLDQIKGRQAYSERPKSFSYGLGEGLGATGFMAIEWALTGALFGGAGAVSKTATFGEKVKRGLKQATQVSTTFGLPEITAGITERMSGTQLVEPTEDGYKIRFANNGQDFPTAVVMGASLGYVNNIIDSLGGELLGTITGKTTKVVNKGLLKFGLDVPKALSPMMESKTWKVLSKAFGGKGKLNQLIARSDVAGEMFEEYLQTYTEKAFNGEDLTITPDEHKQIVGGTILASLVFGAINVVTNSNDEQNLQEGESIMKSDPGVITEEGINNLPPKVKDIVVGVIGEDGKQDVTKADFVEMSNQLMSAIEEGKVTAEDLEAEPDTTDLGSIVRREVSAIREAEGISTTADLGVSTLPTGEEIGDVKKVAKYLSDYGVEVSGTTLKVNKRLAEDLGVEQVQKLEDSPIKIRVAETSIATAIQMQDKYSSEVGTKTYDDFVKSLDDVAKAVSEIKKIPKYKGMSDEEVLRAFHSNVIEDNETEVDVRSFSEDAQMELANITNAIQEAMSNPPRRGSSYDEATGERRFFKEGFNYPDVVSEPYRKKAIMEKVVEAILNSEVPARNTNAYFAYQEIINSVRDDKDVEFDEDIVEKKEEVGQDIDVRTKKETPKKETSEATKSSPVVDNEVGKFEGGETVSFKKIENGKVNGLEEKRWTIDAITEVGGKEKILLVDENGKELWTTAEGIVEVSKTGEDLTIDKDVPEHIRKGIKLSRSIDEAEARRMAINMISPYAQRGDDYEGFLSGQMGATLRDFTGWASLGGYVNGKKVKRDDLTVSLADGRVFTFKAKELWEEAKIEDPLADLPFRIDSNGELELNRSLTDTEKARISDLNEKYFGDRNVNFVERLLTPEGQDALGKYGYSWIDLVEGQAEVETTYYHEAGHKAFSLLSPEQKKSLISQIKKIRGEKWLLNRWGNYKEDTINKYLYAGSKARDFEKKREQYKTMTFLHDKGERFEVSDRDARLYNKVQGRTFKDGSMVKSGTYVGKLSEFFRHPEFFAQYPDAQNIQLNLTIMNNPKIEIKGQISEEEWSPITKSYIPADIELVAPNRAEARNGILHELQHWVQRREGFAKGGNIRMYTAERKSKMADIQTLLGIVDFEMSELGKDSTYIEWKAIRNALLFKDEVLRTIDTSTQDGYNRYQIRVASIMQKVDNNPKFKEVAKKYEALLKRENNLKDQLKNLDGSRLFDNITRNETDFNKYLRTAGEVEARDVEFRSKLNNSQRAKLMPLVGQGIAIQDMIVRYRGVAVDNVDITAEEELVEIFAQYMKNPTQETLNSLLNPKGTVEVVSESLISKIKKWFDDLIEAIRGAVSGSYDIRSFYNDITSGKFRKWENKYSDEYDYRYYLPSTTRGSGIKESFSKKLLSEARNFKTLREFVDFFRGSATQFGAYKPELRKYGQTESSARISDLGVDPELDITIYRGIDSKGVAKGSDLNIKDGDFVTTDPESASGYTSGTVVSKEVKAKDLIIQYSSEFDADDPFFIGAEFIYSDSSNPIITYSDKELEDIFNKATGGDVIPVRYRLEGSVKTEKLSEERELEKRILDVVDKTPAIRLPELLSLTEDLLGNEVEVKIPRMRKFGRPRGYFSADFSDPKVVLNRELFAPKKDDEGNVIETDEERMERVSGIEKTLAHEIGHAIDFIGDPQTIKRGNLLGRIATLHKFMNREYDGILNKDIKKELKALSLMWKPFDEKADADFTKYRYSAPELYADALSVMFNDYELLRTVAPNFHDSFFRFLARKPKAEAVLLEAWDRIKLGRNVALRFEKMKEGYAKANTKRRSIDVNRETKRLSLVTALQTAVVTEFAPVYKQIKDMYKDKGIRLSKEEEVRTAFEKMQTTDNRMRQYVKDVEDNFLTPLIDAGVSEDTIGAIMQLERQLGDRKDVANPQGLIYQYAKETLDKVKEGLNENQKALLDERLSWFRELNFKLIENAYKEGVFSQQFFEEIATVNKNSYTPFAVIDYISRNRVYAGLIKMKGTVKQVENPIITQVLKSVAIIQKTEENSAKKKYIEVVFGEFNNELIKVKAVRDSQGRFIKWKEVSEGMTVLELLEDGKKVGYEVDPYIAKVFDNVVEKGSFQDITRTVLKPFRFINRNFKLLVTTLRPSFWYSNIVRDMKRSDRMIYAMLSEKNSGYKKVDPIGFEFMFEWIKSLPKSVRFAKGDIEQDPELRKMIDLGVLSTKEVWATEDYASEVSVESVLAPAKRMTGLLYNEKVGETKLEKIGLKLKKSLVGRVLGWFYDKMESINRVIESNTKIAGYQILTRKGMSEERAGMKVRNYVGTPNFRERGNATFLTNEIFVFSNVAVQAWRTEAEIAIDPKTRSGYALKMSMSLAPKILLILAELGLLDSLFGSDEKDRKLSDMFKRMTEYDKTNFFTVPISWVGNKVLYWRLPSDEAERGLHALMRKTITTIVGKGQNWSQIADLFAGQVPFSGTNPTVEILRIWTSYLRDNNPYDSFRGRLAIREDLWNVGGVTRLAEVVKLSLNETGLTTFSTYDPPAQSTSELILRLPVLERALRLTDYGITELERNTEREKEMLKARDNAKIREKGDEIKMKLRENPNYNYENDILELQKKYGDPENTVTYTNIRKKVKEIALRDKGLSEYDRMIQAPNSDSKVNIAKSIKKDMSENEFEQYLKTLAEYEIMTDAMNSSLEKQGVIEYYLRDELKRILDSARKLKPEQD